MIREGTHLPGDPQVSSIAPLYDLDALPEDGKRYELADGWLTELSPSPWHDHAADRLKDILKNAARLAGAEAYVADGPNAGRYALRSPMAEGRDVFVDELLAGHQGETVEPVSMPAEAPLFLMYTSGTTGRPKGCVHSTGGYLAYVAGTSKYYQDIHPDDVYWCMADIGWITGHSYIVYGPLALDD